MCMLLKVDYLNDKNLLIIVILIGFGLGFNIMLMFFNKVLEIVSMFIGNGIVMSSIIVIILNFLFNGLKEILESNE